MLNLILRLVINAAALILVAYLIPNFEIENFSIALISALVLGIINALIRPILVLLTLPINLLTLGLFTFVINAFMLWVVSSIIKGFDIANFGTAILAAIVLWAISITANILFQKQENAS